MPTEKLLINTSPVPPIEFWYSPSLQRSYSSIQSIPKNVTDIQFWSSILEFNTYRELTKVFSKKEIIRQHKVLILPKSEPYFREWTWKVDFLIKSEKLSENLYVESKGGWIKSDKGAEREFVHMLQVLSVFYPFIFRNLILVSDIPIKLASCNIQTIALKSMNISMQAKGVFRP